MKQKPSGLKNPKNMDLTRSGRSDGQETREKIIACAGKLYARQGYYKTTSKSICEAAGVNLAAVNYHFGNRDALYIAVLEEAQNRLEKLRILEKPESSPGSPGENIQSLVEYLVSVLPQKGWPGELWTREFLTPSPLFRTIAEKKVLPKFMSAIKIFSEYLGYPEDDPRLYAAIISAVSPLAMVDLGRHHPITGQLPVRFPVPELKRILKQNILLTLKALRNPDKFT